MKNLDIERLTMGELATIEKLSEQSITTLEDETAPKAYLLAALAMVAKRRSGDPGFKWGDALALTMDEVSAILGLDDEPAGDEKTPDAVEHTVEHADADLVTLDAPTPKTTRRKAADPT